MEECLGMNNNNNHYYNDAAVCSSGWIVTGKSESMGRLCSVLNFCAQRFVTDHLHLRNGSTSSSCMTCGVDCWSHLL